MAEESNQPLAADAEFWHALFVQLGTPLAVVDADGRIAAVNAAVERLLGRAASTMAGQDLHSLLHRHADEDADADGPCALRRALARRAAARGAEDGFFDSAGRLVPVAWSTTPVTRAGAFLGTAVLFTDITASRSADRARTARTSALEDLTDRLTLVAEVTAVLTQTLDTEESLSRLGRLLIPRLADWTAVDFRTGGEVHRVAVTGPEGREAGQEEWHGPLPPVTSRSRSALARALHGGEAIVQGPEEIAAPPDSPLAAVQAGFLKAVGATSVVVVPLGSGGQLTGALTLARTDPARPYSTEDVKVAADIGRQAGVTLDNTRRFGRQRDVSEAMQRNLLAPLPRPGRLRLAARYEPAPAGSQVGGDWYDAFVLRDGVTALVIGDVVGHDLTAAAGMAQLHGMVRSLAWDRTEPPGAIVDRLDEAMPAITTVSMATLVLARVEGRGDGPWQLCWTSAGHPPPLLTTPDGNARYLEDGQGLILGSGLGTGLGSRPSASAPLPPGATLLLYTDGMVETPGTDLDTGLGRLRRHAGALAGEPLDAFCDLLLTRLPPGGTDDVALLALRVPSDD
ncbi:SpoIIE family protein phosphatase [Streptomyces marincola]|uniref:SpoIIE family protein phosphatase n=1 Tax=Streptomyces marincola TaxID=2878388 RepID=UPI001CF41A57|nr:SpoIIE family protein phosphatase [Streptomyces marincola]UCM87574.1 SpoIIE family protein phosphatase [Streptomyces marincola]